MFGHWLPNWFQIILIVAFLFYSYRVNKMLNE